MLAGWGGRHHAELLSKLSERLKSPLATTSRAKGIVHETPRRSVGVLGSIGGMRAGFAGLLERVGARSGEDEDWWFETDAGRKFFLAALEASAKDESVPLIPGTVIQTLQRNVALPTALSAQLDHPDGQVVCLIGDGGFGMLVAVSASTVS